MTLVLALLRSARWFHRTIGPVFRTAGLAASQGDILETLGNKAPLTVNALFERGNLWESGYRDQEPDPVRACREVGWRYGQAQPRPVPDSQSRAKVEAFLPTHNAALAKILKARPLMTSVRPSGR